MSTREDHRQRVEAFLRRLNGVVPLIARQGTITVRDESSLPLAEFSLGQIISVKDGVCNVNIGERGIKRKGDLVGMGGFYYHPNLLIETR